MVVHGREGAIYLYGGESYQPYMYHNAVNRLELPPAIAQQMIDYAGTTAAGLQAMEDSPIRGLISEGLAAAAAKAREIG